MASLKGCPFTDKFILPLQASCFYQLTGRSAFGIPNLSLSCDLEKPPLFFRLATGLQKTLSCENVLCYFKLNHNYQPDYWIRRNADISLNSAPLSHEGQIGYLFQGQPVHLLATLNLHTEACQSMNSPQASPWGFIHSWNRDNTYELLVTINSWFSKPVRVILNYIQPM